MASRQVQTIPLIIRWWLERVIGRKLHQEELVTIWAAAPQVDSAAAVEARRRERQEREERWSQLAERMREHDMSQADITMVLLHRYD